MLHLVQMLTDLLLVFSPKLVIYFGAINLVYIFIGIVLYLPADRPLPYCKRIMATAKVAQPTGEGLRSYYKSKIEELEIQIRDKQHNLMRLEAQRNSLNTKGNTLLRLSI